jgi:AcrR family transcriptional regulator
VAEQDRRVRRTRRLLHEALVSLILDKGYQRITVQDILDRADVGRATFYAHYRDKDALLLTSFDGMLDELRRELDAMEPGAPPANTARPAGVVFDHAYRHQLIYQALCGKQGGAIIQRYLHQRISDLLREHLRPHLAAAGSEIPADIIAEYYTSGTLGLLAWWVDHDFQHGPAWLARSYQQLAVPGILAALRPENPDLPVPLRPSAAPTA